MNEVKNLAKRIGKVIDELIDDLNERFNIYNKIISELEQRITKQDEEIESLKTSIEEFYMEQENKQRTIISVIEYLQGVIIQEELYKDSSTETEGEKNGL